MKHLLFLVLLLIMVPVGLRAQTMVMTPDSAAQGQNISVTIVGVNTLFAHTTNVSSIDISLKRSGQVYSQAYSAHLTNDSTINCNFSLSSSLATGYYDLFVQVMSDSLRTFNQASAFLVTGAGAYIVNVSPESAYDSQTVAMTITGINTTFESGTTPTVYFQRYDSTVFSKLADSIYSNTSLEANVTIPAGVQQGYYTIVVQNNLYSDTGKQLFVTLGPAPSAVLVPDSGMVSSTFDVSVVGQGTSFAPTQGTSTPYLLNISLKQNGVTYYHLIADTVFSTTLGDALFSLSDSIQPGTYDAEIWGNSQYGVPYDLHTVFYVVPHHSSIRIGYGYGKAKPGDTLTVGINGSGVNFLYKGGQSVKNVSLVNGAYSFPAQNVKVKNDTSLSAFFTVPSNAWIGVYDMQVVEPGTGIIDTGHSIFSITGSYIDTSCHIDPDSGMKGQLVSGCLSGTSVGTGNIKSMYLQQGTSYIPVVEQLRVPPCLPVGVDIQGTASTGFYDLILVLGGDMLGDTVITRNAFKVLSAAGVSDQDEFADLIQNLRVSPNPSKDNATISFTMSSPSYVRLVIYDALGRTVATLCDRTIRSGAQNFDWSASDMPAGNYFYQLSAGENIFGGRIVVQH